MNPGNYPLEVYAGNQPAYTGPTYLIDDKQVLSDVYRCKYGGGEVVNDHIMCGEFSLNEKVSLFLCRDNLKITDIRYAGKSDVWEYKSSDDMPSLSGTLSSKNVHVLEDEKIAQYLNTKIPSCKFWDMFQEQAKEIYYRKETNK